MVSLLCVVARVHSSPGGLGALGLGGPACEPSVGHMMVHGMRVYPQM